MLAAVDDVVVAVAAEDGGFVVAVAAAAVVVVEEREQGEGTIGESANDWVSDEEIAVEMAGENGWHLRYAEDAAEE